MKLRTKLILGFSSMVVLLLTAGSMAYFAVNRVSISSDISEKNILLLDLVSRLQLAMDRSLMPPNDYLITNDVAEREEFSVISNQVDKIIQALYRMGLLTAEERQLMNETEVAYASVKEKAHNILYKTQECANAAPDMEEMDAIGSAAIKKVDLLNQRAYEKVVKAAYQERRYRKQTNLLLFACAIVFIIDACAFSIFIWRSISRPLMLLQKGVRTITGGMLNHRVSVQSRGEFKEFADSFNDMVARLQGSFSDLEDEKDKLQAILLNIVDGVIVTDANYRLLFMNPVAETILGKQYGDQKGKEVFSCNEEDSRILELLKDNRLPLTAKVNYGSSVLDINATAIKKSDMTKIGCLMIVRDITDQEKTRERLEKLAITDSLTTLYNRGYFQHCLEYEFSKAQRYSLPLSLIMIDIDHFKTYNDRYGHQMGDIVLMTLSKLLKDTVRNIDIVARYGGEEFIVILPHTREKEAQLLAERLRNDTENQMVRNMMGHPVNVTISLGVATFTTNTFKGEEDLIKGADDALYKAKNNGRNRVEVYS